MLVANRQMIFTWDWKNTCVVFKWWHIRTFQDFVMSVIGIILLTASYEFFKARIARWDARHRGLAVGLDPSVPSPSHQQYKVKRAAMYGLQVAFSFWLMLVFMTYNGWLMISVAVGAALGNFIWGDTAERTLSCH